jgi:cytochrome c-type biogenesis protein
LARVEVRATAAVAQSDARPWASILGPLVLASAVAWAVGAAWWDASQLQHPAAGATGPANQATSRVAVGAPAPEFRLTTLDGATIRLGDVRGQPLVLNFFASWCDPCKEEGPVVQAMAADAASAGYTVVGVAVEDEREALTRFLYEEGLSMPAALDADSRVSRAYRVIGPPTTFFIDAEGIIRDIVAGPLTADRVQQGLHRAGGEPTPGSSLAPPADSAAVSGAGLPAAAAAGLALALGAGLLSFLSPCVVPLLPAYLGYMTGLSAEALRQPPATPGQRRQILSRTLAFAVGLVLVFTALGASASLVGDWLATYRPFLTRVGGLMVFAFGLHLLGVLRIALLYREFRPALRVGRPGVGGGTLNAAALGAAFAAGWTPCVGPILGSILLLASQAEGVGMGVLLLMAYGVGLGIPFVVTGLAASRALGAMMIVRRHLGLVERLSGVLLVGTGMLLLSGRLSGLVVWIQRVL